MTRQCNVQGVHALLVCRSLTLPHRLVRYHEADFAGVIGLATADFMDSRGIPKGMPKTTTVSSWRG